MTLLISFVTRTYAVQASDRRLTYPGGRLYDDEANKATLLGNQASFAFTGLAVHAGGRMDDLLMESLHFPSSSDFNELTKRLGERAARAINSTRVSAHVRHTSFVGIGYLGMLRENSPYRNPPDDDSYPFLAVVSNAQDLRESWREWADRDFTSHLMIMGEDDEFILHCAGQSVAEDIRIPLERQLRRCIRQTEAPESAARILARTIRRVSASNRSVGPDVMCTIVRREFMRSTAIPKSGVWPLNAHEAVEQSHFHSLRIESSSWLYSPGNPQAALHFGPNFTNEFMMMKGVMAGPAEAMAAWVPKAPDRAVR